MLVGTSAQPESALERLSPGDRALLELSLRRHVPDDEVATLLRSDREEVERKRASLLSHVAHELGLSSPEEAADALLAGWGVPTEPPGDAAAEAPATVAEPLQRERNRRRALLVALLAVAALAALVLLTRGGDEEQQSPPPIASEPAPAAPESGKGVALIPVAGADAQASVSRLDDGLLRLQLDRLPTGSYTVWLYNSVSAAVPLVRFRGARGKVDFKLPSDASRYRYLDVSREPADGNANHSGASVLRIPVQQALAGP